jgi:hypothetical protein
MVHKHAPAAIPLLSALLLVSACSDSDNDNPPPPRTQIAGTISAAGGSALDQFVALLFTPAGGGAPTSATTDASGAYSLEIASGTYQLAVTRPGYDAVARSVDVIANQTTTVDVGLPALPADDYIGSAQCAVCHDGIYQTFRQTGHPYKLNKVDGAAPHYPFTDIDGVEQRIADDDTDPADPAPGTDNSLGTPSGWGDITYVIGGFHWKARFMDANGFIVTGSQVQYNFPNWAYTTDEMVAYNDNQVDSKFNCGNCHTTGWQRFDATVNNARQDGLPGMDGTFKEQGIGCESCHGSGAGHAQTLLAADIVKVATPRSTTDFGDGKFGLGKAISCGECHTRDGERDHPSFLSPFDNARIAASKPVTAQGGRIIAKGGLVQHHEQYDEILGIDPDTLDSTRSAAFMATHGDCSTCHDPHKAVVKIGENGVTEFGVDRSKAACLTCHDAGRYDPVNNSRGSMRNLDCADCHMPLTGSSARKKTLANGVSLGDVRSHAFSIDLTGDQFTTTGAYAYPYVGLDFACRNCHGDRTFDITPAQVQGFDFHPN